MYHQRDAHGLKAASRKLGAMGGSRGRHCLAVNVGEVDARLLENTAVTQHPAAPAAACFTLPVILNKLGAVYGG